MNDYLNSIEIEQAVTEAILLAWVKAEPDHPITQFPASYIATFVDMSRAALSTIREFADAHQENR